MIPGCPLKITKVENGQRSPHLHPGAVGVVRAAVEEELVRHLHGGGNPPPEPKGGELLVWGGLFNHLFSYKQ